MGLTLIIASGTKNELMYTIALIPANNILKKLISEQGRLLPIYIGPYSEVVSKSRLTKQLFKSCLSRV